jgi:hypothetical protein
LPRPPYNTSAEPEPISASLNSPEARALSTTSIDVPDHPVGEHDRGDAGLDPAAAGQHLVQLTEELIGQSQR